MTNEPRFSDISLDDPYWAVPSHRLPFHDFNKEIVLPGTNDSFPDGAIGIRVDDNFFEVAALPYTYLSLSVKEIVSMLWPEIMGRADLTFAPDAVVEPE